MRHVWHFNQGNEEIRGEVPFADGTCLRLAHEWVTRNMAGRPFDPGILNAARIRRDQLAYLVSGDKLLKNTRLSDDTVWDSLTQLSAFALGNWGGATFEYDRGLQTFGDLFARQGAASAILCVYGKDQSGGRWGHAMASLRGDTLFDPNTGEWELDGSPSARAQDLKIYCEGGDILIFPGDTLEALRFILCAA